MVIVMVKPGHIWTLTGTLVLVVLALTMAGCQAQPAAWPELGAGSRSQSQEQSRSNTKGLHIVPQRSHAVAELKANDVIKIMRSIGCTDEQIVDLGTDLRDILAQDGAARIMVGKKLEALMQVSGNQVLITSNSRGTFVYDLRRGQIGLPNISPGRPM